MIRYKFQKQLSPLGLLPRPVADVILEYNGVKVELPMYIDSGADISMLPLRFGLALGLSQLPADTIREIRGISGGGIPYLMKQMTFTINGNSFPVRVGWALIEEVPILLGRLDVFSKFKIVFDESKDLIEFIPN